MGDTRKKTSHRFDDEINNHNGKHKKHSNNHKYNGLRILNWIEEDEELIFEKLDNGVESSINKR